jgi:hypothetical protein
MLIFVMQNLIFGKHKCLMEREREREGGAYLTPFPAIFKLYRGSDWREMVGIMWT